MPVLPGFGAHRATRGNWQTPRLVPSQDRPVVDESVKQPLGIVAIIGTEASRIFGERDIDQIKLDWRLGKRTASRAWRWMDRLGVKEAYRITYAPMRAEDLVGVSLWIVKRAIQGDKQELIIATGQDLAFEFAPRWKRERGL